MKRQIIAIAAAGTMIFTGAAGLMADSLDNPTTNDRVGFCISQNQRYFTVYPSQLGEARKASQSGVVAENDANRAEGSNCVIQQEPTEPGNDQTHKRNDSVSAGSFAVP